MLLCARGVFSVRSALKADVKSRSGMFWIRMPERLFTSELQYINNKYKS
jgi:hypothetical protein